MRPSVLRPVLLASHDASSRILTLTLNRPEARNALNRELIRTLTTTLELVAAEPPGRTRAVVIAAAGAAFCSGHDLRELATLERAEAARVFSDCSHLMSTIRAAPAPVIAAVHGAAHAAGCQLAATCDVAVSHHAASFATPGTRIGLFCHTPGVALARAIGSRAALPLLLSGRPVDAPTALRLGLVHEISPVDCVSAPADAALALASVWAEEIASAPPEVLRMGKGVFHAQRAQVDETESYRIASEAMASNLGHRDAREGISAFLEKRPPPEWST